MTFNPTFKQGRGLWNTYSFIFLFLILHPSSLPTKLLRTRIPHDTENTNISTALALEPSPHLYSQQRINPGCVYGLAAVNEVLIDAERLGHSFDQRAAHDLHRLQGVWHRS